MANLAGQGSCFLRSSGVQFNIQPFSMMSACLEVMADQSVFLRILEYVGQNWSDVLFLSSVDFHSGLSDMCEM